MLSANSYGLLILMAIVLGMRHAIDLDHLATIDAMTRCIAPSSWSKYVGSLFSLGHGLIVIGISAIVGTCQLNLQFSPWLKDIGSWISIFFLLLFGILNFYFLLRTQSEAPFSLKGHVFSKMFKGPLHPCMVMLIGALFAISFDTMSQVALFSLSAVTMGGWILAVILGGCFTLGMIFADGFNGWIVAHILGISSRYSRIVYQGLSIIIGIFSVSIGLVQLFQNLS